jgi:hypothetical protein
MDRKFDVAKWRNDQYSKEIEQTDTVSQLRNLIREEIQKILTEEVITKTIEDLTWNDVEGLALPTKSKGVDMVMKLERHLGEWKNKFKDDEQKLEVTIDKKAKKATIKGLSQSDYLGFMDKTDKNPKLD